MQSFKVAYSVNKMQESKDMAQQLGRSQDVHSHWTMGPKRK